MTASESMIVLRSMAMNKPDDDLVPNEKLNPKMAVKMRANMLNKI